MRSRAYSRGIDILVASVLAGAVAAAVVALPRLWHQPPLRPPDIVPFNWPPAAMEQPGIPLPRDDVVFTPPPPPPEEAHRVVTEAIPLTSQKEKSPTPVQHPVCWPGRQVWTHHGRHWHCSYR